MLCNTWQNWSGTFKTRSMNNGIIYSQFSLKWKGLDYTNYSIKIINVLKEQFINNDMYVSLQQHLAIHSSNFTTTNSISPIKSSFFTTFSCTVIFLDCFAIFPYGFKIWNPTWITHLFSGNFIPKSQIYSNLWQSGNDRRQVLKMFDWMIWRTYNWRSRGLQTDWETNWRDEKPQQNMGWLGELSRRDRN